MDYTVIGTGIAVLGFTYTFLRNFKIDVQKEIGKIEDRQNLQDERMFQVLTGKNLVDVMSEERKPGRPKGSKNRR